MIPKYRPYFTAGELSEIVLCLKSHPTPRRMTIAQYLEGFILKIQHGVISPNHLSKPSMEQKLGITPIPISHEITGEAAYQKFLINPGKCTPKEIEEAQEWRYVNQLMSPEEQEQYELAMMTKIIGK
jgi:hypothetical protein